MNFAVNMITRTSVILLCAALLSMFLRRASASTRHAVWVIALTSVFLLPLAAILIPQLELPVLPQASTSITFLPAGDPTPAAAVEQGTKPAAAGLLQDARRLLQPELVWLLGVFVVILRLAIGTNAVRRMARASVPDEQGEWRQRITALSGALLIEKPVRVLFSDAQVSPMTWGALAHTILLPSSSKQWPEERRHLVLAHELAHVKRSDGIIQLFIQLVCALHWFNPLIWYSAYRVRIERERACDDQVLNLGTVAEDYADHLLQVVRSLGARHGLSFAAVSVAQPSQLETRLVSILDPRVHRRAISRPGLALLCILTTLITLSVSAVGVTAQVQTPPIPLVGTRFKLTVEVPPSPHPVAKPAAPRQRTRIGDAGTIPTNGVVPPRVVPSKAPIYTPEAIAAGIEGIVTLEASVTTDAKVKILRVIKGLGYGLDQRAIGAVLDWEFLPATRDGIPVETVTQIDVDFKLPPEPQLNGLTAVRFGPGLTPPIVINRVEPQYSDEARAAHYQGTVVLEVVVRTDGTCEVVRVVRELGFKLDESAVEAIRQWRFKPAMRNGEPVDVRLNVEVNFNLK